MGLRCLIGHDYGEPRTERDRRERGSEVVVTVREYRECTRCGHRRIISENKEVTVGDPAQPEAASSEPSADAAWSSPDDGPGEEAATSASFTPTSSAGTGGGSDHEPMTAAEDDGVILEDESAPARAYGEWPDTEVVDGSEAPADDHEPWPDEAGEPVPGDEDVTTSTDPLDAGPEPTGGAGGPGTDDGETTVADDELANGPTDAGAEDHDAAGAATDPLDRLRPDDRDTELVCPDCGETWPGMNASLRPGDICPECKRGYLDEQVIQ